MRRESLLLFGASGQVGSTLHRLLNESYDVIVPSRQDADFSDPAAIATLVSDAAPALVVNAAAYTAVDAAESDRATAFRVNCDAPEAIARAARRCGAPLIHYSTDYVFDGDGDRPWTESDPPNPVNVYGESKLAGENAIRDTGADCIILRTSWVYAGQGRNFLTTIRRLAAEKSELRIVDDQVGSPTWAGALAAATVDIIGRLRTQETEAPWGLYHLSAAGSTSWYGFAQAILAAMPEPVPHLVPIPSDEYPTAARRPRFSVLDNSLIRKRFGIAMTEWKDQLARCLDGR